MNILRIKTNDSNKELSFDDYTKNEDGSYWTQVCNKHLSVAKKLIDNNLIDDHGSGRCGFLGCEDEDHENTTYVNIPKILISEDICPNCLSNNIANEGPEDEITCRDCSFQY